MGETKGAQIQIYPRSFLLIITSNYIINYIFESIDADILKGRTREIEFKSS